MSSFASEIYVGIDGGGTKCCARIYSASGEILGLGIGGPANAYQSAEQAKESIIGATQQALNEAQLSMQTMKNLVAGAGLAGVNVENVLQQMNNWHHPFKKMYLTTDVHIACVGAHENNEGAVIIAGTGSCGYSFVNGKTTIIGGHGFPIGDKGSGAWVGFEGVKAVLLALDGLGATTLMSEKVAEHLRAKDEMIVEKINAATARDYAQLAHCVFAAAEENDTIAVQILREGANYLSVMADALWQTQPRRMSMIGGLTEYIMPWLAPAISTRLSVPLHQPEYGAFYFARQNFQK